ncbi:hypothetical protein [Streptomyces sp. KL118A]|uniref:hypothetical protein n=1 Tax=Streptomyces sp. KL118A TaxID=3045153 RepID=UPI00278C752F|nr:hypothetical protein [Streptomyces sp. KL118A]
MKLRASIAATALTVASAAVTTLAVAGPAQGVAPVKSVCERIHGGAGGTATGYDCGNIPRGTTMLTLDPTDAGRQYVVEVPVQITDETDGNSLICDKKYVVWKDLYGIEYVGYGMAYPGPNGNGWIFEFRDCRKA